MSYNQGGMGVPAPVAPRTSTKATISLIAGIGGFFILPLIGAIVAIITGNSAKKEIANSAGTVGGEGLAKAGVILGWVGLILWVLAICAITIFLVVNILLVEQRLEMEGYYFLPMLLSLL